MEYGMCIGGDHAKIALCKKLGYDYVETGFQMLANENDASYEPFLAALKESGMRCLSANCFLPSELKVTGPDVDPAALAAYVDRGMKRGAAMGLRKVVFGSSGARNIPEGFPYEKAILQIISFLRGIAGPIAEKHGVLLVIEPLNPRETNVIQSLREGAVIASAVGHPSVRLLADLYHVYNSGDTNDHIRSMTGLIRHAHIAEPQNRRFPAPGDAYDYKSFISALAAAGCTTCSVEARCDDFEADAANAIRALRAL